MNNINPETILMNQIRAAASKYGICFRANVGKVRMQDGRFFDTGLPAGFSDLFGIKKDTGQAFFIEVKTETGRASDRQKHFIKTMWRQNAIAGIARTPEEAAELIETGSNKSTRKIFKEDK